jgi:DNA modification methylase
MVVAEDRVLVPVGQLRLSPRNPRRGDMAAIRESLVANGQYRPLVVNRRTMEVLAGNHTLRAIQELGWAEAWVVYVDVDERRAAQIVLVDNKTADLAGWDDAELAALLADLDDLSGTGFSRKELDALLDSLSAGDPLDEGDVPDVPAEPQTSLGDVFDLGRHRLVCGDARDPDVLAALTGDVAAECLLTDPPYGANYVGKTARRLRIKNDRQPDLAGLLPAAFASADRHLGCGAPLYVFHPSGAALKDFVDAFVGVGWALRQTLVWVKDTIVLGHADFQHRHESIMYGFKPNPGAGRLGRGGAGWYGDNRQDSVFEVPRPRAAREHPTTKPPELLGGLLRNSTSRGARVLDPFAGSGSTLAACEQLGRTALLVELDPAYCDVIIARYQRLTSAAGMVA